MSVESNISTLLTVDEPRSLSGAYALDRVDRQFLDAQILGLQRHVAEGLIRGQIRTSFRLAGTSASVQAGDILCVAAQVATESDPALAERVVTAALPEALGLGGAVAIAATAAPPGARVVGILLGIVGPSITGLAAGDEGPVVVMNARCEKVAELLEGHWPVGRVDPSGNLTLYFTGLVTAGLGDGGATDYPLSNLLYVDGGTGWAEFDQLGTILQPFATLAAAVPPLIAQMSTTAHVLCVTPGDYSSENSIYWDFDDGDLAIRGMLGVDTFMVWGSGSPSPKAGLHLPSIYCSSTGGIARNLGLDSVHCDYVSVALGTLHARASRIPYLEINGEVWLTACEAGSITTVSTAITITNSTFGGEPSVTFSGAAGELRLDSRSHYEFIAAEGVVNNGVIVPLSIAPGYVPEGIVTTSASTYYDFLAADAGKYYRLTHAAPALWIPTNYTGGGVTVPIGTRIRGVGTAGQVTITPNGKTVNKPTGFQLVTRAAYSPFEVIKVAVSTWELSGDLLPV